MAAAKSLPDFTGCFLDDRYELIKLLGSGSFGVVYKAIDYEVPKGYNNVVAVKILRKVGRSAAQLASIECEFAFHSTVAANEGVVTLFDTFDDAKWCYLVLDFCDGGDLFDQIITKQTYAGNDELLREAFLSLVDAIQGCHDAGIAHRDLKPENILTNKDGSRCYLADFGLASDQPLVREFGVGTSLYMSPECIGALTARQSYDPFLSDIWSLGIILVNMITMQNPWARATPRDDNFREYLLDPNFLYSAYPMSDGAHNIILSLLELHPPSRMSLSTLRQEILALDTFFRPASPFEHVLVEHEYTTTSVPALVVRTTASSALAMESQSEPEYESPSEAEYGYKLIYVAPEIDIPGAPSARDCSAGSAADGPYSPPSSTTPSPSYSSVSYFEKKNSCSSERASSGTSDAEEAVTPDGTATTTVTTAYMLWDRIMAGAHLKQLQDQPDVRGYCEGWQSGAMAQTYQYHYCPEYYVSY